ncbi:FAD:protein FMN transferase [Dyadobacter frigoris]|uniref:FAD:protein FMN transferase n=2 Tax=Dyadobacter frigoris TaxID=2576211 RepID=A0A4U6D811_9BACT|nr:FAD:protein FMN transferase [Dyadobacter frigoris]
MANCYDLPMISIQGEAQGTTYHIKYFDQKQRNIKIDIDSILLDFDTCLSLYRSDSELSDFNKSTFYQFKSPYFFPVLKKSKEVYEATNGAFDPTILPLVIAYGFGPNKSKNPKNTDINALLKLIDFKNILFDSIAVKKTKPGIQLDFNGIAQGYSVDIIGDFLVGLGINQFMVEIGGEILCKGYKADNKPWVTGIENPLKPGSLFCSVQLSDRAMTTAGNYRNHFEKDGQVFNHIINPKTGSMEQSSLLSVTVFASDAITADGYDTAFFVMGLEETKRFLSERKDIDVCILYSDDDGKLNTYLTDGIKNLIKVL